MPSPPASSVLALIPALTGFSGEYVREVWADIDGDGLQDLYILAPGADDRLLQNQGDGSFVDIGAPLAGVQEGSAGRSMPSGEMWMPTGNSTSCS